MARERTFTYRDELGQLDRAGASSLNRAYSDADQQHHEQVADFYNGLHSEIQIAREQRQMAMDRAATEHRLKYENAMAQAIPKLYAIDPSSPTARAERAAVVNQYPFLMHAEKNLPSLLPLVQQHERMSGEIEKQRNSLSSQNEREAATDARLDKKESAISDRQDKSLDAKEKAAQAREDAKEAKALSNARLAHQTASAKVDELQARIDKNREYYNIKDGKNEPDKNQKDILDKSYADLVKQHDAATMAKNILESVHPEILTPTDDTAVPPISPGASSSSIAPPASASTPFAAAAPADAPAPIAEPTAPVVSPDAAIPAAEPDVPSAEVESAISRNGAMATPLAPPTVPPVVATDGQAAVPAVSTTTQSAVVPAAAPHPYEGKRVLQKSTGKYGTFTNGQFVPESTEGQ